MKTIVLFCLCLLTAGVFAQELSITEKGRYTDGRDGACEISTYDATAQKLYTTNAASDSIDIVSIADVTNPTLVGGISVTTYGGGVNSVVALGNGYIATAMEANVKQDSGKIVFFDTAGVYVADVMVGALPDMVTVTPDGNKILVANEGEPDDDYLVDPDGSVAIIDISGGVASVTQSDVTFLNFTAAPTTITGSLQKPGTTWAADLEPEYIAVNAASTQAAVVCQENNIMILIDLQTNTISSYKGLGFKDYSAAGNGFDASNVDGIDISTWDVKGVYQPDAIDGYSIGGADYWVSANEGDGRDYDGYSSETRIKSLTLDATVFPNAATLQGDSALGRLKTFTADVIGDTDNDGDVDELYSYGARSFSIWDASGNLVWDSGDDFEQYISTNYPTFFNCNDGLASEMDDRSDDKGPEPEAIVVGGIGSRAYAFIGLERQGGVMVYNVTDPTAPTFETYLNSFDVTNGTMTDIAPEGILFISAAESHTGTNLLVVSHEVSGTTTIYEVEDLVTTAVNTTEGQQVVVYPNPARDVMNVQLVEYTGAELNYTLYNALGAVVRVGRLNSQVTAIDASQLPRGVYYLNVVDATNNAVATQKVIKQ